MTRRRWIADTWNDKRTSASLLGDQAMHLARVLRAQPGQIFDVVANGFLHRAEIVRVSDAEVVFTLQEEQDVATATHVHLLMAVFKFDHLEWGIEKATELGVARITPVVAARTEKHLAQAAVKRVERWRRIALEAAKQSRRVDVPMMDEPVSLAAALAMDIEGSRVLLAETEQTNTLWALLEAESDAGPIALAIGPEGGWAPAEMALFDTQGWRPVTLGPRILRAETAAIAALAVCNALRS